MKEISFMVKGMSCYGCLERIKRVLLKIDGVQQVDASLNTGQFVMMVQDRVTKGMMMDVIKQMGYRV